MIDDQGDEHIVKLPVGRLPVTRRDAAIGVAALQLRAALVGLVEEMQGCWCPRHADGGKREPLCEGCVAREALADTEFLVNTSKPIPDATASERTRD